MLLFPFIAMPVGLACILVVGFSLEWMGFEPGPAIGAAAFLAPAGAIMYGLSRAVGRLRRCPSCTAVQPASGWLSINPANCRSCGQYLTTDAFDAGQSGQAIKTGLQPEPASSAHRAPDDDVRKFRSRLRKGRIVALVWAGAMITCMISFVGLPRNWSMVVFALFGVLGAVGAVGLNVFTLSRTCPHCRRGFGWQQSGYPWAMPDVCAACNQSLHPQGDKSIEQQGVPYGKR
jgi:hypothetical protein